MSKKVFLAEFVLDYEGSLDTCIFSTRDKAEAFVAKRKGNNKLDCDRKSMRWVITEYVIDEEEIKDNPPANVEVKFQNWKLWHEGKRTLMSFTTRNENTMNVGKIVGENVIKDKDMSIDDARELYKQYVAVGYVRV